MSISKEQEDLFNDILTEDVQEEQQQVETTDEKVEDKVENVEEGKEEQPKDEDKEDSGLIELDDEIEGKPTEEAVSNYEKVAEFLELEDKSESAILDKIATIQQSNEMLQAQLEQKGSVFYDDKLKAMNDIAKSGGDYTSYLNQSQEIKGIESAIETIKSAKAEDGVRDYYKSLGKNDEWIDAYFDRQEEEEIEAKWSEVQDRYLNQLNGRKKEIQGKLDAAESQAKEFKEKYVKGISNSVNELESISGVKIRPSQKVSLKKELLANGVNGIFPKDENGVPDTKVWVENMAKVALFDKLVATIKKKQSSKVEAKNFEKLHNIEDSKDNIKDAKVESKSNDDYDPMDAFM